MQVNVRTLIDADAAGYFELRREALEREPYAFGSSPEDDRFRSVEAVREMLRELGFVVWGVEPSGLRVQGQDLAEYHMVLRP